MSLPKEKLPELDFLDISHCGIEELPLEIILFNKLQTIIFVGNSEAATTRLKWLRPDLEII